MLCCKKSTLRKTAVIVAILLIGLSSFAHSAVPLETLDRELAGKRVEKIWFKNSLNLNFDDLVQGFPVQAGKTLAVGDLTESVRMLMLRAVFSHVDILVLPGETGIQLEYVLTPEITVAGVTFSGNSTLDERQLLRLTGIRTASVFDVNAIVRARERLREGYAEQGHFYPQITVNIQERFAAPQVTLNVLIDEGVRSKIGEIELVGTLPKDAKFIDSRLSDLHVGIAASSTNMRRVRRALLVALRNEGYLQASVDKPELHNIDTEGSLTLVLKFRARDPISIIFSGNKTFSTAELLAPLKIKTRTVPFTPNAIRTLAKRIQGVYQDKGYFFASATASPIGKENNRRLYEVTIEEGPLVRLKSIYISGNQAISDDDLRQVIESKKAGILFTRRWKPGFLRKNVIDADIERIQQFYESKGYFDSQIRFSVQHIEEEQELELTYHIVENERRLISHVELEWRGLGRLDAAVDNAEVEETLELLSIRSNLHRGDPYTGKALEEERKRIRDLMRERGYYNANVLVDENPSQSEVYIVIEPGVRVTVGDVFIRGNIFTHDYVIRRALRFSEGDKWRHDTMRRSEQSLFQLGSFRSVRILPLDGALDSERENAVVDVTERDTGSLSTGLGYDTEDGLHVEGEIGQRNLYGIGHALVFGLDAYFKTGKRIIDAGNARIGYRIPNIHGSTLTWYNEIFGRFSLEILDQFSYDRIGTTTSLSFELSENLRGSVSINAFNEDIFDVEDDVVIGPNDEGETFYTFLRAELDYDRRDDPYNPRKGWRSVLRTGFSTEALGSNVNLIDLFTQQSFFVPLTSWLVFANNARVQYLVPFSGTDIVPLSHRIFLGGRATLRGFSLGEVGPEGADGNIVGGDTSFILNSELQFDVTKSFITVLFLDAGQTFLNNEDSFAGDTLDFSDLRFSPGLGLRYRTPVGPISVDYGFVLDREPGESSGRLNVGVGGTF